MKKTTIYDIAQALNVTVSTVSRALSGSTLISKATTDAVLKAAKQMNYTPNKLASALKSGKTFIVGIIVPSVEAHYFASIIHSIEEVLKEDGYRIILFQTKESVENEIKGVKTLLEAQVDGIMASMSLETDDVSHFHEIINQNKPLVLFDRINKPIEVPTISLDDFQAGYLATVHLIKNGYNKIAFITTSRQIRIFSERLRGYTAAMNENSLSIMEDYIIFGGLSVEDGRLGAEKLMKCEEIPDAVIAADDFTALGVIKELKRIGKTPPQIGVIGFADEGFSEHITPGLSSIDQHPSKMGLLCAEMFLKMVKQKNVYQNVRHIVMEPTVIERTSTNRKY
ncbi:LacI family DNA-binding transcriptional regulator [Pedobacter sp. Leaf170]|uniref:LacI family DNA-binding transcriptional regulator n=1 Tax=Pedobacter sp. Leaf170 TaxID=2876558 RepID=UPI001E45682B|nr:LacI family DNA-binding transcriptional regulator [Pedobacter sp. Leaf170]